MPFFTAALAGARFTAPVWDAAPTGDFFAPPAAATSPDAFPAAVLAEPAAAPDPEAAPTEDSLAAAAATFFTPSATPAAARPVPALAAADLTDADSPAAPDFFAAALEAATLAPDLAGVFRDAVPFAPAVLAVARPVPVLAAADVDVAAPDAFPDVADFLAAALFLVAVRLVGARFAATAPDLEAATLAPVLADADLTDAVFPDVALFLVADCLALVAVLLAAGFLAVACLAEAVPAAAVAVLTDAGFLTLVSAPVFEDLPAGALPVDLREAAPEPEPGLRAALAAEVRDGAAREGAGAVIGFLHFTTSRSYRYHFPELSAPPG